MASAAASGRVGVGIAVFGVLAVCSAALLLLAYRSETYRELTEEPDERYTSINTRAWAGVGVILTLGNMGAFIGDLASGRSGDPYYWLIIIAALAYIVLVAFQRRHS